MKFIKNSFVIVSLLASLSFFGDSHAFQNNESGSQNQKVIQNVEFIKRSDSFNSCEAIVATMLLKFHKYDISTDDFYDKYLIKKDWYYKNDGVIHCADPHSAYVGNARIKQGINQGFGCYASVLVKSLNKAIDRSKHEVIDASGSTPKELCEKYIDNDIPVMVFATVKMAPPNKNSKAWKISSVDKNSNLKIGDDFYWTNNLNCLILIGYDNNSYIFNDPTQNRANYKCPKKLFERIYDATEKQAIVIKELSK